MRTKLDQELELRYMRDTELRVKNVRCGLRALLVQLEKLERDASILGLPKTKQWAANAQYDVNKIIAEDPNGKP